MYRLLSLFDYSGQWSNPFREKGWDVIQWDIKLSEYMDIMLLESAEVCLDLFEDVHGIIAAPPCTDFTVSGAQYWPIKDEDGRTWQSVELVRQVQRMANLFRPTDPDYDEPFFWCFENPVGRLPKLLPELEKPFYFQPWEFAAFTNPSFYDLLELDRIREKNGCDVTDEETELILRTNAYNKRTGLWGDFNTDMPKNPVAPVKASQQGTFTQRYGGNSDKTKELRSNTPAGFAWAFCEANHEYKCYTEGEYFIVID